MKNIILFIFFLSNSYLFGQMPNTLSKAEKVFGLSKFWQEVNYNFIYLDKIDRVNWDKEYQKLITEVQETKNDYDYYLLLRRFCALLKDGHTNVYFPNKIQQNLDNTFFGEYRFFLSNIEGKAIITHINLSKKEEIPIGSEIIKINGLKTEKYIDTYVKPYISSSTEYVLEDWCVQNLFLAPKGTSFDVQIKLPNNKIKTLNITHSKTKEDNIYPPFEGYNLLDFKWLKDSTAYIALNSFSDAEINRLFIQKLPELYKAKSLIIDLRENGGGNTSIAFEILQYLVEDTLLYGSRSSSRLHIPTYKAWGKWTEAKDTINNREAKQEYLSYKDQFYYHFPNEPDTIEIKGKRITVPTVILIGHNTASAAEDFLIYLDKQKHITKIGEPSFGSTGQPMMFELPGGGSARICTKKDTYPDGREFVGYGVQPDIFVKKDLSDYLENKDPVMEKALLFLTKNSNH